MLLGTCVAGKGPLTALLGGEELLADDKLRSDSSGKFTVLAVMCSWYDTWSHKISWLNSCLILQVRSVLHGVTSC